MQFWMTMIQWDTASCVMITILLDTIFLGRFLPEAPSSVCFCRRWRRQCATCFCWTCLLYATGNFPGQVLYLYCILVPTCTAHDTRGCLLSLGTVVAATIQITSSTGYRNDGNASGVLGENQVFYLSSWIIFPSKLKHLLMSRLVC